MSEEALIFILIVVLPIGIGIFMIAKTVERARIEASRRKLEAQRAERKRLESCRDTTLWMANNIGYIARQVASRDDIGAMVDSGMDGEKILFEILDRVDAIDGTVLGYQPLGGAQFPVKLTQDFRDRHLYIVGKSGSGKTTLIRTLVYQDLERGHGIGVIAPEQEMITEEILPYIPPNRVSDVIYFNPADTDAPVVFNPLHLDPGEDIDLKADESLAILKRVIGDTGGTRMEEILRQTLYALMEMPEATLLDVERLLDRGDDGYRREVIRTIRDEATISFFEDSYPSFPRDAHLPITTRLGRLVRPRMIRNILCRPGESLNFRDAMDTGKILLFNLSDGILGELNAQILGQLVVSKLQMAAMSRADTPSRARKRFYLYIDEFQTFTGNLATSYEKILSRARKYRLSLILAHQQTGQIPQPLLKEILGNVSTVVSFVVSSEDAHKLCRELLVERDGEMETLAPQQLLKLRVGQSYCKVGQQSFFMQTYPVSWAGDHQAARLSVESSRERYGSSGRLAGSPGKGEARPGRRGKEGEGDKRGGEPLDDLGALDPEEVF